MFDSILRPVSPLPKALPKSKAGAILICPVLMFLIAQRLSKCISFTKHRLLQTASFSKNSLAPGKATSESLSRNLSAAILSLLLWRYNEYSSSGTITDKGTNSSSTPIITFETEAYFPYTFSNRYSQNSLFLNILWASLEQRTSAKASSQWPSWMPSLYKRGPSSPISQPLTPQPAVTMSGTFRSTWLSFS